MFRLTSFCFCYVFVLPERLKYTSGVSNIFLFMFLLFLLFLCVFYFCSTQPCFCCLCFLLLGYWAWWEYANGRGSGGRVTAGMRDCGPASTRLSILLVTAARGGVPTCATIQQSMMVPQLKSFENKIGRFSMDLSVHRVLLSRGGSGRVLILMCHHWRCGP